MERRAVMWTPTGEALSHIYAHAIAMAPAECCGVIADNRFRPIKNLLHAHVGAFQFDMRVYAKLKSRHGIEAIVHSHPSAAIQASDSDRVMIDALKIPWVIVSAPKPRHIVLYPVNGRDPLIGRSEDNMLVRDALWDYGGVETTDADLILTDDEWKHCDVAILPDGRPGVLFAPGELLHCPQGGVSKRDLFDGDALHFRHRSFL